MGTALVTLPDGRKAKITYDTEDQLHSAVAELEGQEQPTSVSAGKSLLGIPRQVGLAARYGIEGAMQFPAMGANLIGGLANKGMDLVGSDMPRFQETNSAVSDLLTKAGLPQPQGANERVIADASRLVSGAGTMAGGANALAKGAVGAGRSLLSSMAANPGSQAASAVGAGLAGGSVREAGGGPWQQFAASLLGGVAAPMALSVVESGVNAATSFARQKLAPNDIESKVQLVFERSGVDWKSLSAKARQQLVEDSKAAVYSGQELDEVALRRLADYRNIGATPLTGDITQDPGLITQQRNLAKTQANMANVPGTDLSQVQNQNAKTVLSTLDNAASSPLDSYATGQGIIGKVNATDKALSAGTKQAYEEARNAAGQDIPLSRRGFVDSAFNGLVKENKLNFLPGEVKSVLNDISKGEISVNGTSHSVPFDVRTIDALKTTLATAQRGATDGNVKRAIGIVRQALEDTQPEAQFPQFGGNQAATGSQAAAMSKAKELPAEAIKLLDKARKLAKSQFDWQESSPFIEDALGGVEPDKFVTKHVINGTTKELADIHGLVGSNPALREAVRAQLLSYIKSRGGADSDVTKFSSAGMAKGLEAIGDRKMAMWFSANELSQIKSALKVAKYMQSQPIGSSVNNSGTAGAIMGKVFDVITSKAKLFPLGDALVSGPITNIRAGATSRQLQNVGKVLNIPITKGSEAYPTAALALGATVPPRDNDRRK
jgi:hypothetical protein